MQFSEPLDFLCELHILRYGSGAKYELPHGKRKYLRHNDTLVKAAASPYQTSTVVFSDNHIAITKTAAEVCLREASSTVDFQC